MDEEVFHAALREDPGDELTWQALADFLDDSGQAERGELLRLMRRPRTTPLLSPCAESARARQLLEAGVKPVSVELTNSIGMRFMLVLPGAFLMGSPEDEEGRYDNEAQHEVTITRPFWLGVFPVTQGQWKVVLGDNPSYFRREGAGKESVKDVSDAELDLFPVEQFSWEDAREFLKKLAALKEEVRNGREYRLPSEAEWEYACRGGHLIQDLEDGHTLPFHFDRRSLSLSSMQANFDGSKHTHGGAAVGPYLDRPSRVGSYKPNALGIFDVHGNVWEWCSDWFDEDYYNSSPFADPLGPEDGSDRVGRGGSWYNFRRFCRAAAREGFSPSDRSDILGFRVAVVPHE
jgi:uncharacterized protein (TIGR02996 family)